MYNIIVNKIIHNIFDKEGRNQVITIKKSSP